MKKIRPECCRLESTFMCSNWNPNTILSNCRGCPYLKDEYRAKAVGRFK